MNIATNIITPEPFDFSVRRKKTIVSNCIWVQSFLVFITFDSYNPAFPTILSICAEIARVP